MYFRWDRKYSKRLALAAGAALACAYLGTAAFRAYRLRRPRPLPPSSPEQSRTLEAALDERFPQRKAILKPLPYPVKPAVLNIGAAAAIAVDAANGNILYEKNADAPIPPASMTKIAAMFVVCKEISAGRIAYADVVPLPPESWACNMPPRSSLMFLGKNQRVTVEELLTGLAVCSGNDAAYALAHYVSGGMTPFIAKMNAEVSALGLTHTHFEEVSGYSEKNTATAREMAALSCAYLAEFPETLDKFHAKRSFTYPKEHNLAPEDRKKSRVQDFSRGLPEHITMAIQQENTNPLLGTLSGCDGLKTGYIEESGYNLALTAKRGELRIISVTMGGRGQNHTEGNEWRVKDGTQIMEWAFSTFADYRNPAVFRAYPVPAAFLTCQQVRLVPAYQPEALCVPVRAASKPKDALNEVSVQINAPRIIRGTVQAGDTLGFIEYKMNGITLERIPLTADRTARRANWWLCAADILAHVAVWL